VRVFDVVEPLQHVGVHALRARLSTWLSTFEGPVDCEVRDLTVSADDRVAFCHSLTRFSGTLKDGGNLDMWVRFTTCLLRTGGRWLVTHEHASVPFDPETQRASLDLEP
jgi:ketosteroid isomerase-like protein